MKMEKSCKLALAKAKRMYDKHIYDFEDIVLSVKYEYYLRDDEVEIIREKLQKYKDTEWERINRQADKFNRDLMEKGIGW